MPKIRLKVDLFASEKFPSEILASLIREHNKGISDVKFLTSKECLIEGHEIRIRKSDIEKALNIFIPLTSDWYESYLANNPVWQKSIIEIEGNIKTIDDELIIEQLIEQDTNERRKFSRAPIKLNITANIKSEKEHEMFNGVIIDMCENGIGIYSKNLPKLNEVIDISFEFQSIGLKFENVKAVVTWERNDLERFGARWIELKEIDKKILKYLTPTEV